MRGNARHVRADAAYAPVIVGARAFGFLRDGRGRVRARRLHGVRAGTMGRWVRFIAASGGWIFIKFQFCLSAGALKATPAIRTGAFDGETYLRRRAGAGCIRRGPAIVSMRLMNYI